MRISTSMQYYSGKQNLLNNQGELNRLQNQLSTGRKVLTPSDDPVASTRSIMVGQSKSKNEQYMSSQDIASSQLALTDSMLGSTGDVLQSIIDGVIQAGDGTYTDSERQTMAKDFQQRLDTLVDMANSKSASGDYIFGGYRTNEPPFKKVDQLADPTTNPVTPLMYASYQGDNGALQLQLASTAKVAVTEDGNDVFIRVADQNGNQTGESVFDTVRKAIEYLKTPNAPNADPTVAGSEYGGIANYNRNLANLNIAVEHINRHRSSVGAREQMVAALNQTSVGMDGEFDRQISELVDLDYTSAITDFTLQQTQLQASQQTFMKVSEANLFSYL
jgi:flagellar hook-associated protein 3 FlgL